MSLAGTPVINRSNTVTRKAVDVAGSAATWFAQITAVGLLIGPIALVVWVSFGADSYTKLPPSGYALTWYENVFTQPEFMPSFWVSVKIAAIVTPIAAAIGTLAAFGIRKFRFKRTAALQALLASPVSIPLIVTGIALLFFFNFLEFRSSFWNIVIGHVLITFPYAARTVAISLARYDVAVDEAAASLGARPWKVFWHITLPIIRPGIFAGALFAFILSFDDFTVTIFLVGTSTYTLPIAIYHYMEWNTDPTVSAVSTLLVIMTIVIMLLIERFIGLDRFIGVRG